MIFRCQEIFSCTKIRGMWVKKKPLDHGDRAVFCVRCLCVLGRCVHRVRLGNVVERGLYIQRRRDIDCYDWVHCHWIRWRIECNDQTDVHRVRRKIESYDRIDIHRIRRVINCYDRLHVHRVRRKIDCYC